MPDKKSSRQPEEYRPQSQNFHETSPGGPNISPGEAQRIPPAMGINTTDPTEIGHEDPKRSQKPLDWPDPGADI